jgi:hypothetical protein
MNAALGTVFLIYLNNSTSVILPGNAEKAFGPAARRGHLQLTLSIFAIILRGRDYAFQSQSSQAPVGNME